MITISKKATNTLLNLIKKEQGSSALLYLKGGGCNGFSYKFKILNSNEKPHKLDEVINIDSTKLYLCHTSLIWLLGTHIDYVEDIMGSRFDFKNEKISSKCGCGTSFNFKIEDS